MNGGPRSIQRRRKEKGFTLIELMVVVAIIAILASIGIPKMNAFIRTAETAEATAQFGRVVEASSGWRTLHNDNLTAFNGTLNVTNGTPGGTLMGKVPHLQLASDAKWTYVITSNASAFCINATKDGTQVWYSSTDKTGTDGWDDGHVNKVGYVTNDTAYNAGCAP